MGNTVSSPSGQSPLYDRQTFPRSEKKSVMPKAHTLDRNDNRNINSGNQESSRMLFLMYLINRTWNVVSKRWVTKNKKFIAPASCMRFRSKNVMKLKSDEEMPKRRFSAIWHHFHFHYAPNQFTCFFRLCSSHSYTRLHHLILRFFFRLLNSLWKYFSDDEMSKTRFLDVEAKAHDDNYSCVYGSECSYCSCGYCEDENCRINGNYSICERWVEILLLGWIRD